MQPYQLIGLTYFLTEIPSGKSYDEVIQMIAQGDLVDNFTQLSLDTNLMCFELAAHIRKIIAEIQLTIH